MPNATDGKLSSVWYCGADCQKAHWMGHKVECKAAQTRQALYRAGSLARQIFYSYAKTSFMWNPGRFEKIGTTWLVHTAVYTGTSQLMPFPYALFPDVLEQEALLTHQSCNNAVSEMHDVVEVLLKGLCSKIDEVSHFVKGANHNIRRVYSKEGRPCIDATDYVHTVLRVTMKNGETYVLDMTGAQYGWHEAVASWPLYEASRVRSCREVQTFGGIRVFCKARAVKSGGQMQWVRGIKEQFGRTVDGAVDWWQKDHISLTELLRLPEHDFQKNQASLVDAVEDFLQRHKNMLEEKGSLNVAGGFKEGIPDRVFTSSARGIVSSEGSPLSTTA